MLPTILTLLVISAMLFALVTWFCDRQGFFDEPIPFLAIGTYLIVWGGGTVVAGLVAFGLDWLEG